MKGNVKGYEGNHMRNMNMMMTETDTNQPQKNNNAMNTTIQFKVK